MMVADHSAANAKLKALAAQKKVVLPSALDKGHQKDLDKLSKAKPGKDFDETYADLMEDSHDKAVKLFEGASKNATDPDVSAFASATLPTLRQHQKMAEALDDEDVSP
jgi:putative membrane protein